MSLPTGFGLGPYRCGFCLEFFSNVADLRAHKKCVHPGWSIYTTDPEPSSSPPSTMPVLPVPVAQINNDTNNSTATAGSGSRDCPKLATVIIAGENKQPVSMNVQMMQLKLSSDTESESENKPSKILDMNSPSPFEEKRNIQRHQSVNEYFFYTDEDNDDDDEDYEPGSKCQHRVKIKRQRKFRLWPTPSPQNVTCPHCQRVCANRNTLEDHIRSQHTGEKPFICKDCGKGFHSKITLSLHQRNYLRTCNTHRHNQDYDCKGAKRIDQGNANEIEENDGETGPNKMEAKAEQTFTVDTNRNKFGRRKKIQLVKSLHCPYTSCRKLMSNRSTLYDHIRLHTGEKPFRCSDCTARFSNKIYLHQHRKNKMCLPNGDYKNFKIENSANDAELTPKSSPPFCFRTQKNKKYSSIIPSGNGNASQSNVISNFISVPRATASVPATLEDQDNSPHLSTGQKPMSSGLFSNVSKPGTSANAYAQVKEPLPNTSTNPLLKCDLCNATFESAIELLRHDVQNHPI